MPTPSALFENLVESEGLRDLSDRIGYGERWKAADILANLINANLEESGVCTFADNFPYGGSPPETAHALTAEGIAEFGSLLDANQIGEIIDHFGTCCCFNAHVPRYSDKNCYDLEAVSRFPFGSYRLDDIVRAPHLIELANHPSVLATAAGFLGTTPSLYSLNAWWAFGENADSQNVTQGFHRDTDDFRFCSLFVYLTDVERDRDDHQYYRQTHRPDLVRGLLDGTTFPEVQIATDAGRKTVHVPFDRLFDNFGYGADAVYAELFAPQLQKIAGPAGTAFMVDPFGLHRSNTEFRGRRFVFWARYGLFDNNAYCGDIEKPSDAVVEPGRLRGDLRIAYINRLIVRPGASA